MTNKIWPNNVSVIKLPFVFGSPEKPENEHYNIQIVCEDGEFVKRSANNENVAGS